MAGNSVSVRVGAPGAKQASSEVDKFRDSFTKLQSQGAKGLAIGAGVEVARAGLAVLKGAAGDVGELIDESINAARDLNETINKSQVVFGASAEGIRQWGLQAAASMGLSENAAIGAASTIGNLLLSTGTAPDKIAPMSESIVKLASDLASFNNIDPTEALQKLESGLVGQERPLRELGVAISAASVDVEAAALGFTKVNGTFTEGEKVQARYALIFKQTGTAQGDFARTSGALANSQRIANAEMEDAKAKIGDELLPAELALTKAEVEVAKNIGPVIAGVKELAFEANQAAEPIGGLGSIWDAVVGAFVPGHDAIDTVSASLRNEAKEAADAAAVHDTLTKTTAGANRELFGFANNVDKYGEALARNTEITTAVDTGIITPLVEGTETARHQAVDNIRKTPTEIGKALVDGYATVEDAMQTLLDAEKHPMSLAKREAHLQGILTGKELAKGLRSSDPLVKADALALRDAVTAELDALRKSAPGYGARTAKAYADGLRSQWGYVHDAATYVTKAAVGAFKASSPPGPESPLHEIDKWGEKTGQAWAEGLRKGVSGADDFGLGGIDIAGSPRGGGGPSGAAPVAGSGLTINIYGVSVLTPGSAEALARQIEPHLTRRQQGRGIIGVGAR